MMAKVQAKKAAGAKKSAPKKAATRPKTTEKKKTSAKKAPAKKEAAKKKPAPKKAAVKKPAPKKAAPKKVAVKKPAPKKVAAKKAAPKKAAPKKPEKKAETKPEKKAAPPPKAAAKKVVAAAKSVAKVAAAVAAPVVAKAAKIIAAKVAAPGAPRADEKKRTRRPRTRVQSSGVATANWFALGSDKPRPSSFIPAPPRAEAPSLVAAPPASSDRLIRPEDLNEAAVRTVPVRVDVEQAAGRVYLLASPIEVTLRPGEGIEWDFRYLGGADVTVEELLIEFEKPSPFSSATFRSRKPGAARPHRQLSGAASKAAAGRRAAYTVRAFNMFKTELATTRLAVSVAV